MVTYDEVRSELNAQWNALVIAKPTFINGHKQSSSLYPNVLFIKMGKVPWNKIATINHSLQKKQTLFFIKIIANNRADLDNFISECSRILVNKSITSGWWQIIGEPSYTELQSRAISEIICEEIKMVESW